MVEGNDGGAHGVGRTARAWTPQDNQPTSEIYRLTVDTRWPYWVYGAQQDNSTVAVPSQGNEATYGVGGGESGHIAVDPRDYNIVYAGNYGGTIIAHRSQVQHAARTSASTPTCRPGSARRT